MNTIAHVSASFRTGSLLVALLLSLMVSPFAARFAYAEPESSETLQAVSVFDGGSVSSSGEAEESNETDQSSLASLVSGLQIAKCEALSDAFDRIKVNRVLSYDPGLIAQVGTQVESGHTICCPSFSCAYADVVLDGTVHDHDYYTCSCCTWTDWGGGASSFRSLGSDEELLREAYDQILSGKPTVIHVSMASGGEHWIALIGYRNASDPDHLTLDNFIALDPWDGAQIVASDRYGLYGDCCEHISERA